MRLPFLGGLLALLLGACASNPASVAQAPAPPPSAAPPAPTTTASSAPAPVPATVTLTADTAESTPAGATFTAPAGWSITLDGARAVLAGPEPDLRVAVVDAAASTADEAVASAWLGLRPDFKRPLKLARPSPGRRGWDEVRGYTYEVSPNEKRVAGAYAFRRGAAWTIVLFEGSDASFDKRAAAIHLIGESLRPKGYTRESFAGRTPHKLDADRIKRIVDSVEHARAEGEIPGVAIALVQDGAIVYEGGLGVRQLGKPDKVDAHTRFMIASNTKALTTLLLAKLVDEQKLTWDMPVTALFPGFRLGDAETTRQLLVRHLVCACTGLPRQDLEWLFNFQKQTPKSEMDVLATMQPTTKFGETFQYSNLLASAAGFVAAHVVDPKRDLGAAYDDAMQSRVFGPLGMTETTFDFARAQRANSAAAHEVDIDGKMAPAIMDLNRSIVPLRPAGGAWSSAHDVAKYVQMELAAGKLPNGTRYISEAALLARRAPQVSLGESSTYGMGLMVDDQWGRPLVHHGGDLAGFHSDMFWVPDAGVGGVILTNGPGWLLRGPFMRKTLEVVFDGEPEADDDAAAAIGALKASVGAERPRLAFPPDPQVTSRLAKRYANAALGDLTVTTDGAGCTFSFGGWKSAVATRKNDDGTTSLVVTAPGALGFAFVVSDRDGKRCLVLHDLQHEYVFTES
jgi:CubicO group peptidase (beta-lactamase class C family)